MSTHSLTPVRASEIASYDHEADVVVVGFGCAGASAAWEAATSGADVLVLERAGAAGGSSALSGGELYLGGGTSVQKSCGFDDSADNMYAFLKAALGPHADEGKIRLYSDESLEHFEWLCARGVRFNHSLYDGQSWLPPTKDGLMWLGENAWPYDQVADPVPRGHRPTAESHGGWLLMEKLSEAVEGAGVTRHVDTMATRLVVDDQGAVVGVQARHFGTDVTYRARRGVVLTTGGFIDNDDMLTQHAPQALGFGKNSDGLDDGSGIVMGQAAGAAVRRMGTTQVAIPILPAMICRGMLVDGFGRRFINEDVYPGLVSMAAVRHQSGPYWVIIDQAGYDEIPARDLWNVQPVHVCETVVELEAELQLPAGSLVSTVDTYNADARAGADSWFHKNARWMRELTPPFAAIDPRNGFVSSTKRDRSDRNGASLFTIGGLHTTPDGSVISLEGDPIPGLFAAGRASSSMHGEGYISGTSLGDGTFFGRHAGRSAAHNR